jgi:pimeloyl-ACP methyl ester carboxylesterase
VRTLPAVTLNHHRAGSGEPLVLIHGIGSQWQVWRPLFEHLTPHRDVIALDLPGFGDSPALADGDKPTPARFADFVIDLFDAFGIERPVVAGNSLGGWVALEVARRGRARAVAPISPAGFGLPREQAWAKGRLRVERAFAKKNGTRAEPLVRNPVTRTPLFAGMVARPWVIPADDAVGMYRNLGACPGFDATLISLHDTTFSAGQEIQVPVTVMWGTRDYLLLPRQGPRAVRVLPNARLVPLKGAGHVPTYDAPAEIARELLAI